MPRFTLPLRGLSGEGAQAIVDQALGGLDGVESARAGDDQLLHIAFDDRSVSPADIHDALARAGIVHVADARGLVHGRGTSSDDAGTSTPEADASSRR